MIRSSCDHWGHKKFEHLVELNQSLVFALKLVLAADTVLWRHSLRLVLGKLSTNLPLSPPTPSSPILSLECSMRPAPQKHSNLNRRTKCLGALVNGLYPALCYSGNNVLTVPLHPLSTSANDAPQSLHSSQLQAPLGPYTGLGNQAVTQLGNEGLQVSHNSYIEHVCYLRNDFIRRLEECGLSIAVRPGAANYVVPQKDENFLITCLGSRGGNFSAKS